MSKRVSTSRAYLVHDTGGPLALSVAVAPVALPLSLVDFPPGARRPARHPLSIAAPHAADPLARVEAPVLMNTATISFFT